MGHNMDYCKYENTLAALRQCVDEDMEVSEDATDSEIRARDEIIALCEMIKEQYSN